MTIGQKINFIRKYKGLNRQDFGKLVETSPASLYMYETGRRTPKRPIIENISKQFLIPINYLIDDTVNMTCFTLMRISRDNLI